MDLTEAQQKQAAGQTVYRCGVCGHYEREADLVVYDHLLWPEACGKSRYHQGCIPSGDRMVFALRDQIKALGAEPCA